ncbi:hypothetical protein GCM10011505_09760 [Tistrella bauzanensis]|uniref:Uncharacterized protein n=1 Tax=Tistrella bauzanensis TaxID=657419 RepID=A0ABQ1ICE6_9PROT|nr:hypothetical protein GCM10011505_09760 [Tistrella bauzanensis]
MTHGRIAGETETVLADPRTGVDIDPVTQAGKADIGTGPDHTIPPDHRAPVDDGICLNNGAVADLDPCHHDSTRADLDTLPDHGAFFNYSARMCAGIR